MINSDRDLVLFNLKLKLLSQKTKRSNRCRFNLDKLGNKAIHKKSERVGNWQKKNGTNHNADTSTMTFKGEFIVKDNTIQYNTIKYITHTKYKSISIIEDTYGEPLADDLSRLLDVLNTVKVSTICLLHLTYKYLMIH